ncbi:MAG: hypothetical protein JXM68_13150 [Sedimentisphaerales bacterium]|nr:hypothetical protein [Sedimentisphaerales bacterium]
MTQEQLLENMFATAQELGIELRLTRMDGTSAGGVCKLHDRWILIVDVNAPLADRLDLLASCLRQRPEIETIYLRPQVRDLIEQ